MTRAKSQKLVVSEGLAARIPAQDEFDEGEHFIEATDLTDLGQRLIVKYPELNWLYEWRIRFLWKSEGGESAGRATLGQCTKANSMLKHFAEAEWVIWLAADHCANYELTDFQVEALLYHELLHCKLGGRDMDTPAIRGHDYEIFGGEIRRYGLHNEGLEVLAATIRRTEEQAS